MYRFVTMIITMGMRDRATKSPIDWKQRMPVSMYSVYTYEHSLSNPYNIKYGYRYRMLSVKIWVIRMAVTSYMRQMGVFPDESSSLIYLLPI